MKAPGGETHRALVVFVVLFFAAPTSAGLIDEACDGNLGPLELCDDGNTVSGDGCSFPSCLPEVCGDGVTNPDPPVAETCDDLNTQTGDGCDAQCNLECGNGTVGPDEDCDTSGESATCDDDCTNVECGDQNINETAGETCDDGNTVAGDGCDWPECSTMEHFPLPKGAQACVNAANKNLAGVVKAQSVDTAACLAGIAAGKLELTCIGSDAKGRVAKARAKTTATFGGKKCSGANPLFAFTSAAAVNDAGELSALSSTTVVFGATPNLVPRSSDPGGAACQAEVLKQHNAVLVAWVRAANKTKRAALKGGAGNPPNPPAANDIELVAAIDAALASDPAVAKAEANFAAGIEKKCADEQIDALFDCNAAATRAQLATCVRISAERAACEAIEGADGLDLDCPVLPVP
jgi:cysteine-rich repeat protein